MSQIVIAQLFVVAAVVLIVVHRWTLSHWLKAYTERYGRLPKAGWWRTVDADPTVERWRRRRLAALIPTIAAFAIAMTLLLSAR